MIDVIRESRAPADRLWEVMSDVRQWPRWLPTVDAVKLAQLQTLGEIAGALDRPF